MIEPSLNLGNGNWAGKSGNLLAYHKSNNNFYADDLTFTRASSGTRVNSSGLIETAQIVSTTEEVTNGDFATDSDWTIESTWTISGGAANGNGASGSTQELKQTSVNTIGKIYKATFEVLNYVSGTVGFWQGSGISVIPRSANGTYTEYFTATSTEIRFRGTNFYGSIDNVSVKEVIENDVPRLDYSGGASCASLLLEPQRTNLYLNSEPTANEGPAGNISYVGTSFGLGFNNYTYYLDNSVVRYRYGGTCAATTEYTLSVFVIMNDNSSPNVSASSTSGDFSLVIADGFATPISVTHYGNNIYRVIAKRTSGTSGLSNNGIAKYTGQSSVGFKAVGWQLEAGSYATSYIPTNGSTVTRTADVCNNAGTSATFNSTEGVLFAEIAALAENGGNRGIAISDGTSSNRVLIYYTTTTNQITALYTYNGTTQVSINKTFTDSTQFSKCAFKYKENDCAFWIDGVEVGADNTATAFAADTLDTLNFDSGAGGSDFYGKTKQLMVFNEALSDEELADLTGAVHQTFNSLATFYGYTIL